MTGDGAHRDGRAALAAVGAGVPAVVLAVVLLYVLDPPPELRARVAVLVAAPVAGAIATAFVFRWWIDRARSVVRVLLAVAAASTVLVAAVVAVAAWYMFLTTRDALIVGAVVGLAAALAVVIALQVTRPLSSDVRRLGDVARRVAGGDLTARAAMRRQDELGQAGRAIDHMVNRLAVAEDARRRLEDERAFLLSAIGHDLRTPLAALRAAVESLQDGVAPDPDRYLAAMSAQLDAVQQLIDELVMYARIEAGRFTFEPASVDLAELVDDTVEALTPVADRRGIRLVGSVTGRAVVSGGAAELSRVLRNLVDNALRYGPPGSTVTVALASDERAAHLVVCDEGPGFPADFRPRAFEPFTRADEARDRATGTAGLGLAIARGIVEAHGGMVTLGDGPGGVVELMLPLAGRAAEHSPTTEVTT